MSLEKAIFKVPAIPWDRYHSSFDSQHCHPQAHLASVYMLMSAGDLTLYLEEIQPVQLVKSQKY